MTHPQHKFVQNKNYHRTWESYFLKLFSEISLSAATKFKLILHLLLLFLLLFLRIIYSIFCACNVRYYYYIYVFQSGCCFAILHSILHAHSRCRFKSRFKWAGNLFPSTNLKMPIACDKNHLHHLLKRILDTQKIDSVISTTWQRPNSCSSRFKKVEKNCRN